MPTEITQATAPTGAPTETGTAGPAIVAACIPDVRIITPRRHVDERGAFSESWRADAFAAAGLPTGFVQENDAWTARRGTVRGLHFQRPPFAQAKLVRVVRGSILDVAVDLRRDRPTFGRHVAIEIDAERGAQVFVPAGFAHGYCTLEADTHVVYKVTAVYAPDHEGGVRWDDPDLAVDWPVGADDAIVNDRDRLLPCLRDLDASP